MWAFSRARFGGVVMRVGDRCRVVKINGFWVVVHVPSYQFMWSGFVWEDARDFATGARRKK